MTPDTAALRRDHYDYDCDGHCDDCGERHPCTVRALCDAAGEVERLREEVSLARRIIDLDMRLHAPSASTAGCGGGIGGRMMTPHCPDYCEHPKHDADKALREDLLRDFYRLARTPLPERDASRTAHAALVAELQALCDDSDHGWVHRRDLLALLDRHAPEETT